MSIRRYESLDWLRGLTALSILIFHLGENGYLGGSKDSSSLIGKLGIYGVSLFFIISGLSIAIAYDNHFNVRRSSITFFIRRIFRIWPLLWVAVIFVTFSGYIFGNDINISMVLLNITTLFGFIAPTKYINTGAWSIGNEMVYYTMTPFIIKIYKSNIKNGNIVFIISIFIGLVFSNILLKDIYKLSEQWAIYVNPLNNLFFYISGIAIYYNFRSAKFSEKSLIYVLLAPIFFFVILPTSGDQINIVTGYNRIIFSILCISIVTGFYFLTIKLPFQLGYALEQMGIATYGIYLLHPIVIDVLKKYSVLISPISDWLFVSMVIFITISISWISYRYFEKPIMIAGKKLTEKMTHADREKGGI